MPLFEATPMRKRHIAWWWYPLVILLAIVIAFCFPWRLNFLRDTIAQKVTDGTGRTFAINGDIWLYWLQGPRVTIDGLQMGNPEWASTPQMLTVGHVDTTVSLLDLLHKRFVLPTLTVDKPVLNLEENADGKRNWYFDKQQSDSSTSVVIEQVALEEGHVGYVAKAKDTDVQVDLASIAGTDITTTGGGATRGIGAKATGKWNGQKVVADVKAGDVLKLKDKDTPFPIDAKASVGATRVTAVGTVTDPATFKAADLKFSIAGQSVGDLYKLIGIALPQTPPYQTAGHVIVSNGTYRYDDFTGRVGTSDIAGSLLFEKREQRPFLSGKLVSKKLDLKDFEPVIGKKPTADAPAVAADVPTPKSGKLMPQQTFDTSKWDTLDADVSFRGDSIVNVGDIPFDHIDIHAVMQDRVLTLKPLSFGFAGGTMGGNFRFDGSKTPMHANVDASFADLQLSRLSPKLTDTSRASLGRLNGAVKLDGNGNSIAAMLASGNGSAQISMGRGESSSLLLEAVGLQGPQVVRYLLGDRTSKIQCMLLDFDIKNGDATALPSLIDTDLNVITLDGHADFKDEKMAFKVTPLPKHKSIVVLRTPFYIDGTFAKPSVRPDYGTLAMRGGGAVALGIVNPLLALLPLIETGPGEDSNCAALLEKVKSVPVRNTDTPQDEQKKTKRKAAS